jgi:hypothetical protein
MEYTLNKEAFPGSSCAVATPYIRSELANVEVRELGAVPSFPKADSINCGSAE